MKNETVESLLESGELVKTEDVIFMLDVISTMFERGMESETSSQFISYAMQLMEVWRTSLETNDDQMPESDAVMNIVWAARVKINENSA